MNQASLELWGKRIDDRKSSGLTVVDWCKKNNFSKHTYYYWKKRIKLLDKDGTNINNTPIFAEVKPSSGPIDTVQESLQISWNDLSISISSTETATLAAEFISQLHKRC